jgi:tetratricopeptide (TPR) repeat protein
MQHITSPGHQEILSNNDSKSNDSVGMLKISKDRSQIIEEFDLETKISNQAHQANQEPLPLTLKGFDVLLANGKIDMAFPLLLNELRKNSNHIPTLTRLAKYHQLKSDSASEVKVREVVFSVDPTFEHAFDLGRSYYVSGQDNKALEKFELALTFVKSDRKELYEIYKNIGNILVKQGDFESAEENYHRAYTLNPDSDALLVNLGTLSIQKNDFNEALQRFRRSLVLAPNNDKAWVGLALVHQQMGDVDLALANVMNAIELNPTNRTAIHLLCNWMGMNDSWFQLIDVLQNYLSRVVYDEELSLVLIHAFCITNQYTLALIEIERVLLNNPNHQEVLSVRDQIERDFLK